MYIIGIVTIAAEFINPPRPQFSLTTMDQLPNEILVKIFSNLKCKDLARLLVVCKTINAAIRNNLAQIDQVEVNLPQNDETLPERSIILFKSPKMQSVKVASDQVVSFFKFLTKYCPKLQVLDAPTSTIELNLLMRMGRSLKYFSFLDIKYSYAGLESIFAKLDSISNSFPNLLAFDTGLNCPTSWTGCPFLECHSELQVVFRFLRMKCNLVQKHQECSTSDILLDFRPFGPPVKSLQLMSKLNNHRRVNIPSSLAQNLEVLTTDHLNFVSKYPFSNLKLFNLQAFQWSMGPIISLMSATSSLRVVRLKGNIGDKKECQSLSKVFASLKDLQYLQLVALSYGPRPKSLKLKITAPKCMYHLHIKTNVTLYFSKHPEAKLKFLHLST